MVYANYHFTWDASTCDPVTTITSYHITCNDGVNAQVMDTGSVFADFNVTPGSTVHAEVYATDGLGQVSGTATLDFIANSIPLPSMPGNFGATFVTLVVA